MSAARLPVVVLVSGRGSNMQAVVDAASDPGYPAEVRAVVSNQPDAPALERAKAAGIETRVIDHRDFPTREAFDARLRELVDEYAPGLVVLAGFMRVLTRVFVDAYRGRLINIHPSLLPAFPGLDTHRRALEAGERVHGASVHFVDAALDAGPVIVQARVPVLASDDPDTLAARVLEQEHRILPLAIRWFAEGRLEIRGDEVFLDGKPALASS